MKINSGEISARLELPRDFDYEADGKSERITKKDPIRQ